MSTATKKSRTVIKTSDALKILNRRMAGDRELQTLVAEETLNVKIARMIYDARTRAGLTQGALAKKIGTKQPVIARLEDADYEGHSLSMLQRIAEALDVRLEVEFRRSHEKTRRVFTPG